MGPEIAALLVGGGTAAQMIGQRRQNKERQRILNDAMARNERTQRAATNDVMAEAANFSPDKRLAALQEQQGASAARATADLGGGAAANIPQAAGNVSGAYMAAKQASGENERTRLAQVVGEAAAARAPDMLQGDEALRRASLTDALRNRFSSARAHSQAAEQDASAVDLPLYAQLGKLAQLVGQTALMIQGARGAPAATLPAEGVESGVPAWDGAMRTAPRIRFGAR